MWIKFEAKAPFAVEIRASCINVVGGPEFSQDHIIVPDQDRLDGIVVSQEEVKQFVAMPLDTGYTIEDQLGEGQELGIKGGMQFEILPLNQDLVFVELLVGGKEALPLKLVKEFTVVEMKQKIWGNHGESVLFLNNEEIDNGKVSRSSSVSLLTSIGRTLGEYDIKAVSRELSLQTNNAHRIFEGGYVALHHSRGHHNQGS
jgi:hypothetical protein